MPSTLSLHPSSREPVDVMRIAMIGQKGLPATYGGIERHVEELGTRLAAQGHDVTVFCRTSYANGGRDHGGMRLRHLPTVSTKHLDALVHSALSTLASMIDPPDIVHYHALGPGMLAPLPRYLSRSKVVLTVHGLDHERAKWGSGAQAVLRAAAWMSARVPDATIGVSLALAEHYRSLYGRSITYVPNGVTPRQPQPPAEITTRFGLAEGSYLLFVGRLVPEKAPDLLIRAFRHVRDDLRLVIVGGSSFTDRYASVLRRLAAEDPRVILTGYVYGATLQELYSNAAAFVLPSLLEGLPLTLLEAASYGTPVVVSDIPPHVQVVQEDGPGRRLFRSGDERSLTEALRTTIGEFVREREGARQFSGQVAEAYRWDDVARTTESIYRQLLDDRRLQTARATAAPGRLPRGETPWSGTGASAPSRRSVLHPPPHRRPSRSSASVRWAPY
jgi:glycosyltransferase involved in cell wall biosynthesis